MTPKLLLQHTLPHRLLSRLVFHATRWRLKPWKNFLIRQVVRRFNVDTHEAVQTDAFAYPSFNAFFTRELKVGARPVAPDPAAIVSPADGRISQAGAIHEGRIVQAKGQDFSVAELIADRDLAGRYANGHFVTIYLSPRDYHRVHMPLAGTLEATVHIPGRIFSVAPFAVAGIPRVFARNERLVCHFRGACGPFAVVMVGAMLVSSIQTVWDGLVTPPYAHAVTQRGARERGIHLARADQMGRFNMGSTVIVLLPAGARLANLAPESGIRMGQALGMLPTIGGA